MANTYSSVYLHIVFSIKGREPLIYPEIQKRLWAYLAATGNRNTNKVMSVGGIEDHTHLLLSLPTTISIAKAVRLIKGGSSKWMNETFPNIKGFTWQKGYSVFSVSTSLVEKTIRYIEHQKEHHQRFSFRDEYISLLKKHGIEYDERYIWG